MNQLSTLIRTVDLDLKNQFKIILFKSPLETSIKTVSLVETSVTNKPNG